MLDDLDKELTRRGHRFCRYADDCNIYVRSHRAGERVMVSVSQFLTTKLRLKVNETKSAVARPEEHKFLGFSISVVAAGSPTGYWRMSGHPAVQAALRNHYFDSLGLPRIHVPAPA